MAETELKQKIRDILTKPLVDKVGVDKNSYESMVEIVRAYEQCIVEIYELVKEDE